MTRFGLRSLSCIAALVAAACLAAAPAAAVKVAPPDRNCGTDNCYVTKVASKKAANRTKRVQRQARVRRADRRRVVRRSQRTRVAIWQGWGGSFYLDGRRYAGGNPQGFAGWQNNWEGGFHPVAFWELHARNFR